MGWLRRLFGGSSERQQAQADAYNSLRTQVLQLTPSVLALEEADASRIIAVLMETYLGAVVTLVAVADGTTRLYLSNGGGIIGAGEHEPVRAAAMAFIDTAQDHLAHASLTETFPLPPKKQVRFYFVTGGGVYTVEALENDLGHNRHALSGLFHKGHEVITAIRRHS